MRPPLSRPVVLLAAAVIALAGCAKRETTVEAGLRTRTLYLGNSQEPGDLDPQIITAYTENTIVLALFEGLTAVDETTGKSVPATAESWKVSDDGLTYTFKLRKGVKFHDGSTFSSEDIKATYERIRKPPPGVLSPLRKASQIK